MPEVPNPLGTMVGAMVGTGSRRKISVRGTFSDFLHSFTEISKWNYSLKKPDIAKFLLGHHWDHYARGTTTIGHGALWLVAAWYSIHGYARISRVFLYIPL